MYDSTLIFVTGDHGQTVEGGHPPFAQDAWPMPLVVAGPGVKPGGKFPYSEQIDVVPTLTYLMGVKPPENAMGRIMAEALVNPPPNVPPRREQLKELNLVLLEHDRKLTRLRELVKTNPSLTACPVRPRAELSGRRKNSSLAQSGIGRQADCTQSGGAEANPGVDQIGVLTFEGISNKSAPDNRRASVLTFQSILRSDYQQARSFRGLPLTGRHIFRPAVLLLYSRSSQSRVQFSGR